MIDSFKTDSVRRILLAGAAALILAACGGKTDTPSAPSGGGSAAGQYEVAGDKGIGSKDAKVTIVEYASVVCPACANWHVTVYPDLKKKYVDTGKVRYIFRAFPTSPEELADAGHMIALCAGDANYLKNIKLQFERQKQIFALAGQGKAREAYIGVAKASGLSEDDFIACMQNEDIRKTYDAVVKGGSEAGVASTPSFFINGEKTARGIYSLETLEDIFLPILGEPIPDRSEKPEDEPKEDTEH